MKKNPKTFKPPSSMAQVNVLYYSIFFRAIDYLAFFLFQDDVLYITQTNHLHGTSTLDGI